MFKIIEGKAGEQGSNEWLELRRSMITASEWPIIAGAMTKYGETPFKLYNAKMQGLVKESNFAMERGKRLEEEARISINDQLEIDAKPLVVTSTNFPWLLASLDGWHEETKTLVEIKCPLGANYAMAAEGEIPKYWKMQGDVQMMVLGIDTMYFFIYSDGGPSYLIKHKLNPSHVKKIAQTTKEFYDCMATLSPPALCDNDYAIIDDKEANELARLLINEMHDLKRKEEIVKALKAQLLDLTDDGNCAFSDAPLKISRSNGRSSVDYKALCKDLGVGAEELKKYTKQGIGYPVFKITKDLEVL